ncbi:MAG: hypothetical protein ACRDOL_38860 [Streptosporangiaceae bacterium]
MTHADDLLDVLRAVREAIGIPHGATVGDQEVRDAILVERAGHAAVMLAGILGADATVDIPWSVAYLREQLAKHPAVGYKTWDERAAELEAAKAAVWAVPVCSTHHSAPSPGQVAGRLRVYARAAELDPRTLAVATLSTKMREVRHGRYQHGRQDQGRPQAAGDDAAGAGHRGRAGTVHHKEDRAGHLRRHPAGDGT